MIDSRVPAKTFGKCHKNVLQAYDKLHCSAEFNRLYFQPAEITGEKGELRRSVDMTKDGFTKLAMGVKASLARSASVPVPNYSRPL